MNLLAIKLVWDLHYEIALSSFFLCDVIVMFRLKFTMWAYYSEYVKSTPPLSIPQTSIGTNSDIWTIINLILSPKTLHENCKRSVLKSLPWPPSQDSLQLTPKCQFADYKLDIYWIHMVRSDSLSLPNYMVLTLLLSCHLQLYQYLFQIRFHFQLEGIWNATAMQNLAICGFNRRMHGWVYSHILYDQLSQLEDIPIHYFQIVFLIEATNISIEAITFCKYIKSIYKAGRCWWDV